MKYSVYYYKIISLWYFIIIIIFTYFLIKYIFFIVLEGYIKTNISSIYNNKLNKKIGCGFITDGTYKSEIHIINSEENNYFKMDIHKGDKVEIIGIISNTGI